MIIDMKNQLYWLTDNIKEQNILYLSLKQNAINAVIMLENIANIIIRHLYFKFIIKFIRLRQSLSEIINLQHQIYNQISIFMKNKGKKYSISTQTKKKSQNCKENIPFSPFKNKSSKKVRNENNDPITQISFSNSKKYQRSKSSKSKTSNNKDIYVLRTSANNKQCIDSPSSKLQKDTFNQVQPKISIKPSDYGKNHIFVPKSCCQSTKNQQRCHQNFQKLPYRQKYWGNRYSSIFKIQSLPICYKQSSCILDLSEQIQANQLNYKNSWKEEKKDIEEQISQLTIKLQTAKQCADKNIEELRYTMNDHLLSTINNFQIEKRQLITEKEGLQKITSQQKDKIDNLSQQLKNCDMENDNLKAKVKRLEISQGVFKEKIQQLSKREKISIANQSDLRKTISGYQSECSKIKEQKRILKEKAIDLMKLIQQLKNEQVS